VRILVTYEGEEVVGSASSHAMALASPVWEMFVVRWENQEIASTASPSTPGKEKAIDFKEDDGEALLVLLNIAHFQFRKIPDHALHYDLLYNVAGLIDQYQCIDLVKSYKSHWVSDSRRQLATFGQQGWFFIAYVFGLEHLFEEAVGKLARELRTNEEGNWYTGELLLPKTMLLDIKGMFILSALLSSACLQKVETQAKFEVVRLTRVLPESLIAARAAAIEQLYGIVSDKLEYYSRSGLAESRPPRCQQSVNRRACDAAIFGSIIFRLQERNLWPFPSPDICYLSVNEAASRIGSIDLSIQSLVSLDHTPCSGRGFHEMATAVLNQIKPHIEDSHRRHMKVQRGESLA
jgi:hypothetical protein